MDSKTSAVSNWSAENAELSLNQFLRDKKLSADYEFSVQRDEDELVFSMIYNYLNGIK